MAKTVGVLGRQPGDTWVDDQGNVWVVDTNGQAVNFGSAWAGGWVDNTVASGTIPRGATVNPDTTRPAASSGGTTTTTTDEKKDEEKKKTPLNLDWQSILGIYGMPPDVIAEISRIWNNTDDPQQASLLAISYIRGTQWYAQTFPGIQDGFRLGIVSNERDYRQYTNELNQLYRRFYGRDISGAEVGTWLKQGADPNVIAGKLGGEAWVKAYAGDTQYLAGAFSEGRLTDAELQSLGEQNAGLKSTQGTFLERKVNQAFERARTAAQGVLASPSLSLQGGRLSAPGLGRPADTGR